MPRTRLAQSFPEDLQAASPFAVRGCPHFAHLALEKSGNGIWPVAEGDVHGPEPIALTTSPVCEETQNKPIRPVDDSAIVFDAARHASRLSMGIEWSVAEA
jgi:hypothetical protein